MRAFFTAMTVSLLLAGCGTALPPRTTPQPSSTPAAEAEAWVMSPDSFGPIDMETTRRQALATGFYRAAPPPCSRQRLDWLGQNYDDIPGTDGKELAKPFLASITFDDDGRPAFIDPAPGTATDRGIRKADSLSRLQITYGDDLVPGPDQGPSGGTFAVSGARSHLVFVVMYGKVVGFFIASGHVDGPEDVMTVAGDPLTKHDNIRRGAGRTC